MSRVSRLSTYAYKETVPMKRLVPRDSACSLSIAATKARWERSRAS